MDPEKLYETIFKRKSIRKYESGPMDPATMDAVSSEIARLKPLIPGIRSEVRILEADAVKGMFMAGAPHYLAIYSEEKEGSFVNAGFMLQQMDLFFSASGLGCCWQGGAKPTKKVDPVAGLEFTYIIAFGRPAEPLHRKSVLEFKRKALSEISDIKGMDDVLEPVRLAPSGVNNQSWFYRGDANRVDAYYSKSMMFDQMNQVNAGIGMCHLWLSATHDKKDVSLAIEDPGDGRTPKGYRYAASARMK